MAVEINENIEHRFEHFASFGSRESALRKNLGKVFIGMLHHDVETSLFERRQRPTSKTRSRLG